MVLDHPPVDQFANHGAESFADRLGIATLRRELVGERCERGRRQVRQFFVGDPGEGRVVESRCHGLKLTPSPRS
jgi:hypothetical protein